MSVKNSLLTTAQREEGGRTAYDRFDYQTAWGVSKLLDLHESGKNYALAFEFHDDLISLDDADRPAKVIFYQVKTRQTGNWSFKKMTSRTTKNGVKQASYAGKMFDNFVRFGAVVERLVFVSNQPLPEVMVVHGQKNFSSADKLKLEKFVTNLANEVSGFKDPEHTSLFFFAFSDLNLSNYEHAIIGRISEFLEQELGDHIPAKPFALMLNDYCRRRSKAIADCTSFDQLKASKFVTRTDMSKWLTQIRDQHEQRPEWGSVARELNLPFTERTMIERAWKEYEVTIRSRPNAATIAMSQRMQTRIDAAIGSVDDLVSLIDAVLTQVRPIVLEWKPDASDHFVKAAILYEFKR